METHVDDVADSLLVYGIHVAFPEQRAALARRLVKSITIEDLERIGDHVAQTAPSAAAAANILFKLLDSDEDRTRLIEQLNRRAELKADRQALPFGAGQWQKPLPIAGEDQNTWARRRNRAIAFARVVTDRRSVAAVAEEMELPSAVVRELVAEERATIEADRKAGRPATVCDTEDEIEARRKRFVAEMQSKRRVQ